jgi:hypothetical protein
LIIRRPGGLGEISALVNWASNVAHGHVLLAGVIVAVVIIVVLVNRFLRRRRGSREFSSGPRFADLRALLLLAVGAIA